MTKQAKIELLMIDANVDRVTAIGYLEAEEWIYVDALYTLRCDRKAGLL